MTEASNGAAAATDPLTGVLTDLVSRGRAGDVSGLLARVPDLDRRAAHLTDTLACAVRLKRPGVVAELLTAADESSLSSAAATAESLADLADDTEALYAVLTRLGRDPLRRLFRGCLLTGSDGCQALALRLLPHLPCVDAALPAGPDEPATPPLVLAAERGCLRVLAALLDRQATVEAEDARGRTALAAACAAGQAGAARLLLARGGADPARADAEGRTCQPDGAVSTDTEIADLLAAAECLGSSQPERAQSRQLHGLLCRCGFTARRAELHCEAADFLLLRLARPLLARRSCRLVGSFAEGWGACLVQANGRPAIDSDVNWVVGAVCGAGGDDPKERPAATPSGQSHAGTLVSVDWEPADSSRQANQHEAARVAQLLRGGVGGTNCRVGRTGDLPSGCFAEQERRVMRHLSTLQGQLFVVVKVIFKRLLPSIGASGLTSYHAKTVLFFMLARHSRRRGWWQPESLLPLVRKALELTLELLDLDERPCVCMPHFFAEDCQLAFREPVDDTKARVRDALEGLRADPGRIDAYLRSSLRPMRPPQTTGDGETLFFHPYMLLPPMIDVSAPPPAASEFAGSYWLVLRCLTDLASSAALSDSDKAAHMARLSCLPAWCHCARQCLVAMAHLRSGDRQRAAEMLTLQANHRVQRCWDMERCNLHGDGATASVATCGDWGWRFCFGCAKNQAPLMPTFQQLPLFPRTKLLQPRSESPNRLYVNFRCLVWSLSAELLPRHMVQPADWHAEMKLDPDYQELLTLAQYSDSPLHLHYCTAALNELRERSRQLDLSSDIEAVRAKLSSLTGTTSRNSEGWKPTARRTAKKVSSFKR